MSPIYEIQFEGHKLVALALNPATTSGRPIILFHGIGSSIHFWNSDWAQPFLEHGPCYALTLPGHYPAVFPSGFSESCLTPEFIARILAFAIRRLVGNQAATLVGMSAGGLAVLVVAAHAPEIAQRIISISGFVKGKLTGTLGMLQWLARRRFLGRTLFKKVFLTCQNSRALFRLAWLSYVAAPQAFLLTNPRFGTLINNSYVQFRHINLTSTLQYFTVMEKIDISDLLCNITVPTLVLSGDKDPIVRPSQSCLIAQKIQTADLYIIKGGGHLLCTEKPAEYHQILNSWLSMRA